MKKPLLSIPIGRLIIYCILLGALPLTYIPYHHSGKKNELHEMENFLEEVALKAIKKEEAQAVNKFIKQKVEKTDIHFLSRLEKLNFLSKEKEEIEKLMNNSHFPLSFALEERFLFLQEKNHLHFLEKSSDSKDGIHESLHCLEHSVEVNVADLKELLHLIEEKEMELLISDFKMTRKTSLSGNETFEIDLQILKRDF